MKLSKGDRGDRAERAVMKQRLPSSGNEEHWILRIVHPNGGAVGDLRVRKHATWGEMREELMAMSPYDLGGHGVFTSRASGGEPLELCYSPSTRIPHIGLRNGDTVVLGRDPNPAPLYGRMRSHGVRVVDGKIIGDVYSQRPRESRRRY